MSVQKNLDIANQFLARLGSGASPEEIAKLFSADLDWHIPGDSGVLPWVGRKTGRAAVADFVRESSQMIERLSLDIHDVMAGEQRAIIFGELATRILSTGNTIETAYAIVLTIVGDEITRFLMLEDSFATSAAAQG
ncbi:nuclear transport factor 2 family protein [Xanthomonas hyacinthi]|uniref:Ketosteroid isomerase n=1 Tax=Xanthomonas hyacinthi TaxID=56455 RepID=A0A2S7EYE5_9XANT|nr:nuclear transport factor 2 family protein [Xanthomonas hyacinthi]PPU98135.1 ketosteroid isomerase [Xanthomonas hyacinthi]QGY76824.1 nuclear transport factor 2 family protein [Xanthomonas hyacinthi]